MTRTEFVRAYAERSGLDPKWARLGTVELGDATLIAMPCSCENETCEGWAMLNGRSIIDHLELHAPDDLRAAYRTAVDAAGGK